MSVQWRPRTRTRMSRNYDPYRSASPASPSKAVNGWIRAGLLARGSSAPRAFRSNRGTRGSRRRSQWRGRAGLSPASRHPEREEQTMSRGEPRGAGSKHASKAESRYGDPSGRRARAALSLREDSGRIGTASEPRAGQGVFQRTSFLPETCRVVFPAAPIGSPGHRLRMRSGVRAVPDRPHARRRARCRGRFRPDRSPARTRGNVPRTRRRELQR